MSLAFLRIDGDMIQRHGTDAALLHALIQWRSKRAGSWVASFADITDDIGLTVTRAKTARQALIAAGLVECVRGIQSSLRWTVITEDPAFITEDPALSTTYLEKTLKDPPADAPLSADLETPMDEPLAPVTPIDGGLFPSDHVEKRQVTPAEMANECRQAWLVAYTAAHGRPHPALGNRAFGQIKQMIRTCQQPDDYRDVWRAAQAAGEAGEWAVMNRLGPAPQSRFVKPEHPNIAIVRAFAEGRAQVPARTIWELDS